MIGHGVGVNFAYRAFLGADRTSVIAEMINRQRNVGSVGFADRFTVIPGFGLGQHGQIGLHDIGDFQQCSAAFGHAGRTPRIFGRVGGIQRQLDIFFV